MSFQFEQWQIDELQTRLDIATQTQNYVPVYDWIFWSISENAGTGNETARADVDKSVWLWGRVTFPSA